MTFKEMQSEWIFQTGITPQAVTSAGAPSFDDVKRILNLGCQEIVKKSMCLKDRRSFSYIAYIAEYPLANDCLAIDRVTSDNKPIDMMYEEEFDQKNRDWWDTLGTELDYFLLPLNRKVIRTYPIITSSAKMTTLNGNLNDTDTQFRIVSTAGFDTSGRVLIDSEVISYSNFDSTTNLLQGCVRGEEGTIASPHATGTVVTKRNFIYRCYKLPATLVNDGDISEIPLEYHLIAIKWAVYYWYKRARQEALAKIASDEYTVALAQMIIEIQQNQYQRPIARGEIPSSETDEYKLNYPADFGDRATV